MRLKVFAPDDDVPAVASVNEIWASANWFEREAFDLFGIIFEGHLDLRRILTDYGFIGHPMRKDFPTTGHVEMRYDPEKKRVIYQPVTIEPREIMPRVVREDNYGGLALTMAEIKNYTLNFGPQHPAAHGVLRLVLELDGEVIQRADPHIGLLHRATEKLAESKTFIQALPYMDRLDYVSMMCNEHAYCLAIEKLLGVDVPERAQYIRVMFSEITRLLNHLLWLGAHGLDCGAMNIFIYCFREREDLFDMYEAVSGARMHAAYFRPGGVYRDLPDSMPQYKVSRIKNEKAIKALNDNRSGTLLDFIDDFTKRFPKLRRRIRDAAHRQPHLEAAHGGHRRRHARARAEPRLHRPHAARLGHRLGPAQDAALRRLRPHGLRRAGGRRTATPTTATWCASRRCARATASSSSASHWLRANPGPVITDNHKVAPPSRVDMKSNMEELIHHFKLFTEGMHVPEGEAYAAVEHPKGEFGIYLVSDGANKPYRLKIRAAGLRAPGRAGRDGARPHDRRRGGDHRHHGHRVRRDRQMTIEASQRAARWRALRASEVAKYPADQKQSAVMACLAIVQHEQGHVSPEAEDGIAAYLGMAPIAVHEVTTFYNMYNQQPVGALQAQRLHQPAVPAARRRQGAGAPVPASSASSPTAPPPTAASPCSPASAWAPAPTRR